MPKDREKCSHFDLTSYMTALCVLAECKQCTSLFLGVTLSNCKTPIKADSEFNKNGFKATTLPSLY